ncbi:MAG: MFS transporter [Alphaproteobacteria bacterium]
MSDTRRSPYLLLKQRGFVLYWTARVLSNLSMQVTSVAVGWYVYDVTRDPLDLGFVGLAQFLPALVLVLFTGQAADRFNRRRIMALCMALEAGCAATLLYFAFQPGHAIWPIFVVLTAFGCARAFMGPAALSLLPNIVSAEDLPNAIALNSSSWQAATILGPVIGGLLYGISAEAAYGTAIAMFAIGALCAIAVPQPAQKIVREPTSWAVLSAGFRFIWKQQIVFGAITLDLFAVLLGGATALLPVYARDILDVGPWGLGLLRSAPGIGAIVMGLYLAVRPIENHAGMKMFFAVGLFGLLTIIFGISTAPWLSIAALALMGAADMISVYVRQTLVQLVTPDNMRGRVNAVNMVFVGASNELGEFRAGVSASWIGTIPAVVIGGIGTMAVAVLWAARYPQLRRVRRLTADVGHESNRH